MNFWSPIALNEAAQGQWVTRPSVCAARPLTGLTIDSRAVKPGNVFLAIRGEKFDGHDFLAQAAAAGAGLLMVSDAGAARTRGLSGPRRIPPQVPILLVDDTVAALQRLARAYRQVLREQGVKVIAVGGSNGKTTTRHLIHGVLSAKFRGTQSPKSFNNHLGVPLTLLGAAPDDDFVVVEIGTNHPGEVAALAQIVQPDAAVITSIGHEHMEFFHTLEGVAAEEATLLDHVTPQGLAIVPGDEPLLTPYLAKLPGATSGLNRVRFGAGPDCSPRLLKCELQIDDQGNCGSRVTFAGDGTPNPDPAPQTFFLPLLGVHNARNALVALAVGRWMGMSISEITAALAHATGVSLRMEVRRSGVPEASIVLLTDCYNANPDSVAAALATLAEYPLPLAPVVRGEGKSRFHRDAGEGSSGAGRDGSPSPAPTEVGLPSPRSEQRGEGESGRVISPPVSTPSAPSGGRRIAILGDMLELGDCAPDLHRHVGEQLSRHTNIDRAILIGKLSLFTAEALRRSWPSTRVTVFPEWDADLPAKVATLLQPGDVVLIKASRSIGLERLLPAIEERFAAETQRHGEENIEKR